MCTDTYCVTCLGYKSKTDRSPGPNTKLAFWFGERDNKKENLVDLIRKVMLKEGRD
jgi:hypothetical protein